MKSRARIMTLSVTCVVDKIVTTHFRNPIEGMASSRSLFTGDDRFVKPPALCKVSMLSNQNKQVIYSFLSPLHLK